MSTSIGRPSRRDVLVVLGLVAVALAVRLVPVLRGGGLFGAMTYDDGVYFGSAIAMLGGRVPYRDFLLLHPPGILLVLSPFAALGGLIGDATAFAAARLAFMGLGALNVVLVTVLASRYGRRAALAAGAVYVVWEGAAMVERTTWLIAPQNTLLLLALIALAGGGGADQRAAPSLRRCVVAGAMLGLNVGLQLWGVVPLAVVLAWLVVIHRRNLASAIRPVVALGAAAGVATAIVWGPFLVAAGPVMLRYILFDQAGRALAHASVVERMRIMLGLPLSHRVGPWIPNTVVVGAFATAAVAIAWTAWHRPTMRLWVAILAAQVAVLCIAPPFEHYAGWLAPTAALAGGCFLDVALTRVATRPRVTWAFRGAYMAGLAILLLVSANRTVGTRIAIGGLDGDLASERCVTADAPTLLIETGALARDLQAGCPLILDPTGVAFDVGRLGTRSRRIDAAYQTAMEAYYGSSDAALFVKLKHDGFPKTTLDAIRRRLPDDGVVGPVTVMIDADP